MSCLGACDLRSVEHPSLFLEGRRFFPRRSPLVFDRPISAETTFPQRLPDAAAPWETVPAVSPAQTPDMVDPRRSTCAAPHFATGLRPRLTPTPAASRSVSGAVQMNLSGGSAPLPALAHGAPAREPSRRLRSAADQKSVGRCSVSRVFGEPSRRPNLNRTSSLSSPALSRRAAWEGWWKGCLFLFGGCAPPCGSLIRYFTERDCACLKPGCFSSQASSLRRVHLPRENGVSGAFLI